MFYEEFKKILFKQKFLVIIILIICLKLGLSWYNSDKPVFNDDIKQSKYEWYLEKLDGELTDSKVDFIEKEKAKFDNIQNNLSDLINDLENNKITENDFLSKNESLQKQLTYQDAFNEIYKQYKYVSEDSESRYFLSVNNIYDLVAGENIDYILVFFIIVFCSSIFSYEYYSKQFYINFTSKLGGNALSKIKIILSLSVCVFVCVLFSFIEFVFKADFSVLSYPVQSIPYFESYKANATIIEVFLKECLIKVLGAIYLAVTILFVSNLIKSHLGTAFFGIAINFVPVIIKLPSYILHKIPLPICLLTPGAYFCGTKSIVLDDNICYLFKEISVICKCFVLIFAFLISILMIPLIINSCSSKYKKSGLYK